MHRLIRSVLLKEGKIEFQSLSNLVSKMPKKKSVVKKKDSDKVNVCSD